MLSRKYNRTDCGIIIGRFQVPELHSAHIELIESVSKEHDKVVIFLGVSPLLVSVNNPLDFESRKQMILEKFPNVTVLYLKDTKYDTVWSKRLDEQIETVCPNQSVTLYGSRDSFISHYSGKFPTAELAAKEWISGTEIRKAMKNKVRPTYDFRAGVIWASNNRFVQTYSTVDIAILNEDGTKVLLGKKPYNDKWQFIGGFSSPDSQSYEEDAKREVFEETGLEISEPKYVGSYIIPDWRYAQEKDKVKTLFFVSKYVFGNPRANDDISDVQWFDIADAFDIIDPMHSKLLTMLKNYMNKK